MHCLVMLLLGCIWFQSETEVEEMLTVAITSESSVELEKAEELQDVQLHLQTDSESSTAMSVDVFDTSSSQVDTTPVSSDVVLHVPENFGQAAPPHSGNEGGGQRGGGLFSGTETAESVAYVVDASGSMTGRRMDHVLSELHRSVSDLRDDQTFFLVFFSSKTFPMMWPRSERRLVRATQYNKRRVLDWARQVVPDQITRPQSALRMALKLKPQLLFFLTDGEIPVSTTEIAQQHRSRVTRIHSIEIRDNVGVEESNPLLAELAEIGGGTYRIVN